MGETRATDAECQDPYEGDSPNDPTIVMPVRGHRLRSTTCLRTVSFSESSRWGDVRVALGYRREWCAACTAERGGGIGVLVAASKTAHGVALDSVSVTKCGARQLKKDYARVAPCCADLVVAIVHRSHRPDASGVSPASCRPVLPRTCVTVRRAG